MSKTVHITFVLDRSGSMQSIRQDVIGGFNSFLAEQKAQPGDCKLTMIQFDSQGYDYLCVAEDLTNVKEMKDSDFVPRGGTPLYDAIGRAIGDADSRLLAKKDDEVQLFVIMTDGEENQSKTFDRAKILETIETRQGKGWTFAYLGANQDAFKVGASVGVRRGSSYTYQADSAGTYQAYAAVSASTSTLRASTAGGQSVNPHAFFQDEAKKTEDNNEGGDHSPTGA